ncbi:hypothetical protein LLG39_03685 [bacterium]|nr:hypothetical protein [bacterium]
MRTLMLCMCLMLQVSCAWARKGAVTISRILNEHKIHVVTTEKEDSLSKFLFDLRLKTDEPIAIAELLVNKSGFKDGESILYIIDRSKARRVIREEERLLPCKMSAIDPDQVVLYAQKAADKNAWEILISAPNEKWLKWELERLCGSELGGLRLDERGSILDRYRVKRLRIVSNVGKQVAQDWVTRQSKPGKDTIDWDFVPSDGKIDELDPETDVLFLLNHAQLDAKSGQVLEDLPDDVESWCDGEASTHCWAAERQSVQSSEGDWQTVSVVVAPSERHLKMALNQYSSIESIPQTFTTSEFANLSSYREMIVIARAGDRDNADESAVDDLAGKMTTALANKTGFQCVSRQDLKELVYTALMHEKDGTLDTSDIASLRRKVGTGCALAVVDLAAIDTQTSYVVNQPQCCTPTYPSFSQPQPSKPSEPDPDERKFGLFGGHRYSEVDGSRRNDPQFKRDHREWRRNMDDYSDAMDRWEHDKRDYENSRYDHEMDWEVSINAIQRARITGNLRIYDLNAVDSEDAGRVLFTCPIEGEEIREDRYSSDHVSVRGEGNQPDVPTAPASLPTISDLTIASEAFRMACEKAVTDIMRRSLVPADGGQ